MAELQRAWALGHRTEAASEALADGLLHLYHEETRNLLGAGPIRQAAERALRQEYLEPSLVHHRRLAEAQGRQGMHAARLAFLEGREQEALQLNAALRRTAPWRYEAHMLDHLVQRAMADRAVNRAAYVEAAGKAWASLEQARAIGRSDPEVRLVEADWHLYHNRQMTYRFGEPIPDVVERGTQALDAALRLHPKSLDARLMRANFAITQAGYAVEGWCPSLCARTLLAQAEQDLDQVDAELPDQPTALVNRAWARLILSALSRDAEGRSLIGQAVRYADRALHLAPRDPGAMRTRAWLASIQAQLAFQSNQDIRPHLTKILEIAQQTRSHWPNVEAGHCDVVEAHADAASWAYLQRDWAGVDRAITLSLQEGRASLTQAFSGKEAPLLRAELVKVHRMSAAHRGLRGQSPVPDQTEADRLLQEIGPRLWGSVQVTDQLFSLRYEQAMVQLEAGRDVSASLRGLRELLDRAKAEGLSGTWLGVNWAYVHRLEALWALRRGESPREAIRQGLERLKPLGDGNLVQEQSAPARAARFAFRILEAPPEPQLSQARNALAQEVQGDPILHWLLRPELQRGGGR